jgi:2-polyprenyl-6-methoxyphenol hydroxylase-like FAD-dependent oxidoreductase
VDKDRFGTRFTHPTPRVSEVDVLVIGAGPTGLTAAAEALRHGLSVRIIERKATRPPFSKALVVHARTLEVFDTMGIADEVRSLGAPFSALNVRRASGRRPVRVDLIDLPWGDTAYPYWLSVPQYDTERVLEALLARLGGEVEWSSTLHELTDYGNVVHAVVQRGNERETVRARWVVGCDGGRSTVRNLAGLTLSRTDSGTTFLLADAKSTCNLIEDEGYVYLGGDGVLLIVPMPEPGRWRLIAHLPSAARRTDHGTPTIDAASLNQLVLRRAGIEFGAHDVSWTSQFTLSHGVANHFRKGRLFVAGDAAHIHSPVGGQGLNTGVQDAHNLLWKLAEAETLPTPQSEALLDSYDAERCGTAGPMVRGVARMTSVLASKRRIIRSALGFLAPRALSTQGVQSRLGRGVGMLNLSYPSPTGATTRTTNHLRSGQRLPNPELRSGGRLFDRIRWAGYGWVVFERGIGTPRDPDAGYWQGLPVVFLSHEELEEPTEVLRENRVVLVRPDQYVAAVGDTPESLQSYTPQGILLS